MTTTRPILLSLATLCLSACATLGPNRASGSLGGTCDPSTVDLVQLSAAAAPAVVRVVTDGGHGTGVILASPDRNTVIIATNRHVIRDARIVQVEFNTGTPKALSLANVDVLYADSGADLAFLSVPRAAVEVIGLTAAPSITPGQPLAVFGFPGVAGSRPTLTVERGDITATERVLDGLPFIQTNANINPGNSGGPALDGCGRIVGIVVATHRGTERTGLLIPAGRLISTLGKGATALKNPDVAVRRAVDAFFSALESPNGVIRAAGSLSPAQLAAFSADRTGASERARDKAQASFDRLRLKGLDPSTMDLARMTKVLVVTMSKLEIETFFLLVAESKGAVDRRTADEAFAALSLREALRSPSAHQLVSTEIRDDVARSIVTVQTGAGAIQLEITLRYVVGEWRIDDLDAP